HTPKEGMWTNHKREGGPITRGKVDQSQEGMWTNHKRECGPITRWLLMEASPFIIRGLCDIGETQRIILSVPRASQPDPSAGSQGGHAVHARSQRPLRRRVLVMRGHTHTHTHTHTP